MSLLSAFALLLLSQSVFETFETLLLSPTIVFQLRGIVMQFPTFILGGPKNPKVITKEAIILPLVSYVGFAFVVICLSFFFLPYMPLTLVHQDMCSCLYIDVLVLEARFHKPQQQLV